MEFRQHNIWQASAPNLNRLTPPGVLAVLKQNKTATDPSIKKMVQWKHWQERPSLTAVYKWTDGSLSLSSPSLSPSLHPSPLPPFNRSSVTDQIAMHTDTYVVIHVNLFIIGCSHKFISACSWMEHLARFWPVNDNRYCRQQMYCYACALWRTTWRFCLVICTH